MADGSYYIVVVPKLGVYSGDVLVRGQPVPSFLPDERAAGKHLPNLGVARAVMRRIRLLEPKAYIVTLGGENAGMPLDE